MPLGRRLILGHRLESRPAFQKRDLARTWSCVGLTRIEGAAPKLTQIPGARRGKWTIRERFANIVHPKHDYSVHCVERTESVRHTGAHHIAISGT